jgi:hypothetical protein
MVNFMEKEIFHKPTNQNYLYNPAETFYNIRSSANENESLRMGINGYNAKINNNNNLSFASKNQQKNLINGNMNANDFESLYVNNLKNQMPNFPFDPNLNGFNYIDDDGFKKQKNDDFVNHNPNMFGFQSMTNMQIHNLQSNFHIIIYFLFIF